jgi:hypothetical protein
MFRARKTGVRGNLQRNGFVILIGIEMVYIKIDVDV